MLMLMKMTKIFNFLVKGNFMDMQKITTSKVLKALICQINPKVYLDEIDEITYLTSEGNLNYFRVFAESNCFEVIITTQELEELF